MHPLPTEYAPQIVADFIGPAQLVARRIVKAAEMCAPRCAPAAYIFVGPSGSGKSALAAFTLTQFAVSQWNLNEVFGADLTKEVVREIANSMHLTNLYCGYRGYWFDEIDKATKEARDRLLEIVGDRKQPRETVIVATSNLSIEEFDDLERTVDAKGRFSSRFQVFEVGQPTAEDAVPLVKTWLAEPDAVALCRHASIGPNGKPGHPVNVRALLKDTLSWLQR